MQCGVLYERHPLVPTIDFDEGVLGWGRAANPTVPAYHSRITQNSIWGKLRLQVPKMLQNPALDDGPQWRGGHACASWSCQVW